MDFAQARHNMVEQQIRPWDVLEFELLDVLSEVPREYFVLPEHQAVAYADQALPLANGHAMPEPRIVAKMIQALNIKKTDRILEIGTGSGYATALLSRMGQSVLSLDLDGEQQARAQEALGKVGCTNVQLSVANGLKSLANIGTFDVIYVGGGVADVPAELLHTLNEGGRLVVVLGQKRLMHATLISRKGNEYPRKMLFETSVPALVEEQQLQKAEFEF